MTDSPSRRNLHGRRLLGGLALLFGLVTIVEGGRVILGGPEIEAAMGPVVPFVLIFTFIAGFFYVAAGVMTLLGRSAAIKLAWVLALATILVFIGFGFHALRGGSYAQRTPIALLIRSLFWLGQALLLPRYLRSTTGESK